MKDTLKKISNLNFRLYSLTKDKQIPWQIQKELNNTINLQFIEITKALQQLEKVEEYLNTNKRG